MTFTNGQDGKSLVGQLLPIISPLLSAGLAAWGTVWLQDRAERKKQRGVAHALLADIRKVDKDLGPIPDDFADSIVGGLQSAVPELSAWVRDLMLQIAEKSPEVVGLFLDLQRYLETLRTAVQSARDADAALQKVRSESATYERTGRSDGKMGIGDDINPPKPDPDKIASYRATEDTATEMSQRAIAVRRAAFYQAKKTADDLSAALQAATHA